MLNTCKSCGEIKDIVLFKKDKAIKSGYKSTCKECAKKSAKEWYVNNLDQAKESRSNWRLLNLKKLSDQNKLRYIKNADSIKENVRIYRINNIEKVNASINKWVKENPEKMKMYRLKYREKNAEKLRLVANIKYAENPKIFNDRNKAWARSNRNKTRVYCQNRRARVHLSGGKLSPELATKLYVLQKGKCPCCGNLLGKNYHMDHIIPLINGGLNIDENIQLLRQRCNNQKHSKDPIDFMQSRGFLL